MTRKRKRAGQAESDNKRQKTSQNPGSSTGGQSVVQHALLPLYYPRVLTLREYLLSKLPPTSKVRRKKILQLGSGASGDTISNQEAARLLNGTVVGIRDLTEIPQQTRIQQWATFSQQLDASGIGSANRSGPHSYSQSEIVDFAIWLLFSKANGRVQHLLCQGYSKLGDSRNLHRRQTSIPGLVSTHPNDHVTTLKSGAWPHVLMLMGKDGDKSMTDLILDCGVFLPISGGYGNYRQISGQPLGELQAISEIPAIISTLAPRPWGQGKNPNPVSYCSLSSISFVRSRILYSRPAFNIRGRVRFGLRHIHVLNRCSLTSPSNNPTKPHPDTVRVLMYIFPRQFGLHNVFSEQVDPRQTLQPFKDYTLREDEISKRFTSISQAKIPKRLRGMAMTLVERLQRRQGRCAYTELLEHYCPPTDTDQANVLFRMNSQGPGSDTSTAPKSQISISTASMSGGKPSQKSAANTKQLSLMDQATPVACVSAFCCAALLRIIPGNFWGIAEIRSHNKNLLHRNIDRFIRLRRFESMSLHEVTQGMRIADIEWLGLPGANGKRMSQSDSAKRLELFHELIYYIFDSMLIPLIQTNFYVTESNVHSSRLFFFRHDIWRDLSRLALKSLSANMFEDISPSLAHEAVQSRSLGLGHLRLLPKANGVRPIMNFRRRPMKKGYKNLLGSSVNSLLAPVHSVLTYEKTSRPDRLGSSIFSNGDLYRKVKMFKASLRDCTARLYLAKVDVKAAFDTIPQDAAVTLLSTLPSTSSFRISKHAEIKPGDGYREAPENTRPLRRWPALAKPLDDPKTFDDDLRLGLTDRKRNTVFIQNVVDQERDTDELLSLLKEHVQSNMVKYGGKIYKQKRGIPQGSVLSALMCNYFYADMESRHLDFLEPTESILLRWTDDIFLITTNPSHAERFLQKMHDGLPEYGIHINPEKTLANFEATINGKKIARVVGGTKFPYCGKFIDMKTLDISQDRQRKQDIDLADSLTVEYSKRPGIGFHRKVLYMFKIQAHALFFDTSHNSKTTVITNIYSAFIETASKMWKYARCLPPGKQPGTMLLTKTISNLIDLAFVLAKKKRNLKVDQDYSCSVTKAQMEWLALHAFKEVLRKRQSNYGKLLVWIENRTAVLRSKHARMCLQLDHAVRKATLDVP